jgi:hypothetical protein
MRRCAALDRIVFGTLHQFFSKALSSYRHGYRKYSYMQPSCPNISEQATHKLAIFALEKESDRIPFGLAGTGNVVIDDNRLHEIVYLCGGIGIEYYGNVAHMNGSEGGRLKVRSSVRL